MPDPLTNEETLKLRAFHRQFDRIRRSSIGQAKKVQVKKTTNFDFKTGEISTSFSGYEPEQFQSQLPVFRQFFLQDSINFGHICNIIYQKCDREELKAWIAEARKRWQENLRQLPEEFERHLHQATGSVEEAIEKLFYGYGGLFHVDVNAPEEEQAVAAIEGAMLHRAFPRLCWCLNVVDSVIYWWLDAPDEPVPSPTKTEGEQ